MQQISFSKAGSSFASEPIQVDSNTLVLRVEYKKPGAVVIERSITGENFVPDSVFSDTGSTSKAVEKTIYGCVAGQQLRLAFVGSEPEKIYVLQ